MNREGGVFYLNLKPELDAAIASLEKAIDSTMKTLVADSAKLAIQEAVFEYVYPLYDPTQYERREDSGGGLADIDAMEAEYDSKTKTLEVSNMSRGASDNDDALLTPIIEGGTGYTWKHSEIYKLQPYPRPFIKHAEEIMAEGRYEDSLSQGLSVFGFKLDRGIGK